TTVDKVVFSISGVAPISYPPLGSLHLIGHYHFNVIQKCLGIRFRSWILKTLAVHVPEHQELLIKRAHTDRNTTIVLTQAPFLGGVIGGQVAIVKVATFFIALGHCPVIIVCKYNRLYLSVSPIGNERVGLGKTAHPESLLPNGLIDVHNIGSNKVCHQITDSCSKISL